MSAATLRSDAPRNASGRVLQRSRGAIDLVISSAPEASVPTRIYQQGSVRVRFPNVVRPGPLEAVLVGLTGGLTGGDCLDIGITVRDAASALVTSQACERIYRSSGGDARISVTLRAGAHARLHYLPQPTILFHGGRVARETRIDLAGTASFLAVECVVFGRTAMNETVTAGALSDLCLIRRGGALIHADRFALEGDMQADLNRPSVLGGGRAMATLRYVAADAEKRLPELRTVLGGGDCRSAASAFDGFLVARFVAAEGFTLHRDLARVLEFFCGGMPRMWLL